MEGWVKVRKDKEVVNYGSTFIGGFLRKGQEGENLVEIWLYREMRAFPRTLNFRESKNMRQRCLKISTSFKLPFHSQQMDPTPLTSLV